MFKNFNFVLLLIFQKKNKSYSTILPMGKVEYYHLVDSLEHVLADVKHWDKIYGKRSFKSGNAQ